MGRAEEGEDRRVLSGFSQQSVNLEWICYHSKILFPFSTCCSTSYLQRFLVELDRFPVNALVDRVHELVGAALRLEVLNRDHDPTVVSDVEVMRPLEDLESKQK